MNPNDASSSVADTQPALFIPPGYTHLFASRLNAVFCRKAGKRWDLICDPTK
jgi:hypothetical protein